MMPTLPLEAATERGVSPRSLEWSASRPWPMSRATSASFSWKTADMSTEPPFSLVPLSGAPASLNSSAAVHRRLESVLQSSAQDPVNAGKEEAAAFGGH